MNEEKIQLRRDKGKRRQSGFFNPGEVYSLLTKAGHAKMTVNENIDNKRCCLKQRK
ncbi:MAG TPA: hypothetical protein VEY68_04025 [Anoxybacillus sp.]|nr:hypothetical protein [Anoxybacillus sp.]